MNLDFINEKDAKRIVSDMLKQHIFQHNDISVVTTEQLNNRDFIFDNKEKISNAIVFQYLKLRFYDYIKDETNPFAFTKVSNIAENAEEWIKRQHSNGNLYLFQERLLQNECKNKLKEVSKYLFYLSTEYVEKELNKSSPRIRLDFLKQDNKLSAYTNTIYLAQKWEQKQTMKDRNTKNLSQSKRIMNFSNGYYILQLLTQEALEEEGKMMGHCIGDGAYTYGVINDEIRVYSLRDKSNISHITFLEDVQTNNLMQAKCVGNSKPSKYSNYCVDLLNALHLNINTSDLDYIVKYNYQTLRFETYFPQNQDIQSKLVSDKSNPIVKSNNIQLNMLKTNLQNQR